MDRSNAIGALRGTVLGLLVVLVLHAVGGDARDPRASASPTPTPRRGVSTVKGPVRTLPDVGPVKRSAISDELRFWLDEVYERAFVPVTPRRTPPPTPAGTLVATPKPPPTVSQLYFTTAAAQAIAARADAFRPGAGLALRYGTLVYKAVATMTGEQATRALVNVEFYGTGILTADGTPARLKQVGQLLLLRAGTDWKVSGFDVQLRVDRRVSASDPRRPAPLAYARWMP